MNKTDETYDYLIKSIDDEKRLHKKSFTSPWPLSKEITERLEKEGFKINITSNYHGDYHYSHTHISWE